MRNEFFNGYNEKDSLYLCYCGYENCRAGHGMPPHIRDCYLIHYLVGGTCMVHMDGKSYEASAGDYFVIKRAEIHKQFGIGLIREFTVEDGNQFFLTRLSQCQAI